MMREKSGTATSLQIGLYLAKICTGAGLLGLPNAFHQAGILAGALGVCLIIWLNELSCRVLLTCKSAIITHTKQRRSRGKSMDGDVESTDDADRDSFAAVAFFTLGKYGVLAVNVCIVLTLLGAVAVYMITISHLLSELSSFFTLRSYFLICFIILLPFSLLRDLTWLSWVSLAGVAAYGAGYFAIFYYGFTTDSIPTRGLSWDQFALGSFHGQMIFFGIVTFSIGIPVLAFTLQESMAEPARFTRTLDITLVLVCLAYIAIGVVGVALFDHAPPSGIEPIIISNLPSTSTIVMIVKGAVCLTLMLTAPLSLAPALGMFENMLFPPKLPTDAEWEEEQKALIQRVAQASTYGTINNGANSNGHHSRPLSRVPSHRNCVYIDSRPTSPTCAPPRDNAVIKYAIRIIMLCLVTALAISVPCFTLIVSVIGCCTLSILCFILPPIFLLRLVHMGITELSSTYLYGCYAFVTFGIIAMIASTIVVLQGSCQ